MLRPSITDYISALDNPVGVFRTLGAVAVERDIYGEPHFRAGNSAAIFTYIGRCAGSDNGKTSDYLRFLKCYIRPNPHLRTIYDYIERSPSPLLPRARLLRDELYIHSQTGEAGWVDLVEGEWTEGVTLDIAVRRAVRANDTVRLRALADAFDDLCRRLSAEEWAHGDLKPENIIVPYESRGSVTANRRSLVASEQPAFTLIDCDAMWIPALAGAKAVEMGTPPWRDPQRTAVDFDKRIDDYPMSLISATLRAIARDPDGAQARFFFEHTAGL